MQCISCGYPDYNLTECPNCSKVRRCESPEDLQKCAIKALNFLSTLGIRFSEDQLNQQKKCSGGVFIADNANSKFDPLGIFTNCTPKPLLVTHAVLKEINLDYMPCSRSSNRVIYGKTEMGSDITYGGYVSGIRIIKHLPAHRATALLAHEYLHAWIQLHRSVNNKQQLLDASSECDYEEETLCSAISLHYHMRNHITSNAVVKNTWMRQIRQSVDDHYRIICQKAIAEHGFYSVAEYISNTGRLPRDSKAPLATKTPLATQTPLTSLNQVLTSIFGLARYLALPVARSISG